MRAPTAAAALLAAALLAPAQAGAASASPIQASCFAASRDCRIHVDPFTIAVAPGQRLQSFQLQVGGLPVYDYRTDASNPPAGPYAPTLPKPGFAARCEQTYVVKLVGRDSGDPSPLELGQTAPVTCPAPEPAPGAAALAAAGTLAVLKGSRRGSGRRKLRASR